MILKTILKDGRELNLTSRCKNVKWSGNTGQLARQVEVNIVASPTDPEYEILDLELFRPFDLYDDLGNRLLKGYIVRVSRESDSQTMNVTAMDKGLWLARNQGWYNFPNTTPETATKTICGDFGIELGSISTTGISIKRKFPGVAIHDILRTLWYKASEQNSKRYHIGFADEALTIKEKATDASFVLAPKVNLDSSSITRDGTKYQNTVAIYSESGKLIRKVKSDKANFELEGLLQAIMVQKTGENAEADAKTFLEDNDIKQTVSVLCEGDNSLITGEAVRVQLSTAGVVGLFWIESDLHTWVNGRYTTKLKLNFRNIMTEVNSGTDI